MFDDALAILKYGVEGFFNGKVWWNINNIVYVLLQQIVYLIKSDDFS